MCRARSPLTSREFLPLCDNVPGMRQKGSLFNTIYCARNKVVFCKVHLKFEVNNEFRPRTFCSAVSKITLYKVSKYVLKVN